MENLKNIPRPNKKRKTFLNNPVTSISKYPTFLKLVAMTKSSLMKYSCEFNYTKVNLREFQFFLHPQL